MILCEIRIGEHPPELVRVRDLTETGLKIATTRTLLLGDRVRIRMPGKPDWHPARVAWCAKGVAGLNFVRSIELPGVAGARVVEGVARSPFPPPPRRMAS